MCSVKSAKLIKFPSLNSSKIPWKLSILPPILSLESVIDVLTVSEALLEELPILLFVH